ncbi:unannotated protein [freshwater metagenome]|uniref:Unannotated protein n=1 Tax=freshwater metagenome TaxID=449393 RepID=A0A6J6WNB9_9ZZZZ
MYSSIEQLLQEMLEFNNGGVGHGTENGLGSGRPPSVGTSCRRRRGRLHNQGLLDQLLGRTDRELAGRYLLNEGVLLLQVGDAQEGSGVTSRDGARHNGLLCRAAQIQETQGVGDGRSVLSDSSGNLFVRKAEVVNQLLVGSRFF